MLVKNFNLKRYNTFGINYKADCFISFNSETEVIQVLRKGDILNSQSLILGGGSNLLFTSDFKGIILHPLIGGIRIEEARGDNVIVSAGAGVEWDEFVEWTINQNFTGLENLSLIPGSVGASPVQNIGAYGVEVKNTFEKVRAVSLADGTLKEFNNAECRFGYRDSIFKNELKGKYIITRVFYRLSRSLVLNTRYGSLQEEVEKLGNPSIKTVREAVIKIRKSKLPDPEIIGNAGSFFKNPIVSIEEGEILKTRYPQIPGYSDPSGGIKLAAGWLIEQCGWKGRRIGDAGVHEKQALVLVNYGKATGAEIFILSEKIRESVYEKFGINLEREVEVVGHDQP